MGNYLTSTISAQEHDQHVHVRPARRLTNEKGRPIVRLEDLPEDVLHTVLSKLPAREVVRSSVLSRKWRSVWTTCIKLSFNDADVCSGRGGAKSEQGTQVFIDRVDAVLRRHRGRAVDQFEIKFIFESKLADHLDNWISFAMTAHTKNLAFDLAPPSNFLKHGDHYRPPPAQFVGFPNLRKLALHVLDTTNQDLDNILGSCCKLEWLSIVRCHLKDELKVTRPLSHLRYLRVMHCDITKIDFHAAELSTFVYKGSFIPVSLRHASKLEKAKIWFYDTTFQQAITSLLDGLPDVRNLTLQFSFQRLENRWVLNSPHMFSQLRHVQILLIATDEDADKILYLVSFLRVAPFIEKLEVHFHCLPTLWFANCGPLRQQIPANEYKYVNLKNVRVTGFRGARGQVEFLMHVVENAPAIQGVTVDTTQRLTDAYDPDEATPTLDRAALDMIGTRYHLSTSALGRGGRDPSKRCPLHHQPVEDNAIHSLSSYGCRTAPLMT
ncbi:F-box/FBD/LRR-repeat protein At1g13570-like isoform X2 [Lolium rigidum]|uniref:F-box/FBD/LRR-repeat protein At1g13570-like isoform X2 n=1 Tax=Lolium rigidum TaxID=89674 RepID=UPI001F5DFB89|nr:F-box/FBD/LRR-repeat protein At1g13570-like isoform X2 [Lolium rigidum]